MKALLLALVLLGADGGVVLPDGGILPHKHCWHPSSFTHAVACHSDYVCCLCGAPECRAIPGCFERLLPVPGHGPYAPR